MSAIESYHDAVSIRQTTWFDGPERPANGVWHDRNGRAFDVGIRAVWGTDCAGNPIVTQPAQAGGRDVGYVVSIDAQGYERRRGTLEVVVRSPDGSAVFALQRDGALRGYRRTATQSRYDDWQLDPTAATEAMRVARLTPVARDARWVQVPTKAQGDLKRAILDVLTGKPARNLWLHGVPGAGKTTAIRATIDEATAQGATALYLPMLDLVSETRNGYAFDDARARAKALWAAARDTQVLAIDDLTAAMRAGADDLRGKLQELLDARERHRLPTIVADNTSLDGMRANGYDDRLCSRFGAFNAIDFGTVDHRTMSRP